MSKLYIYLMYLWVTEVYYGDCGINNDVDLSWSFVQKILWSQTKENSGIFIGLGPEEQRSWVSCKEMQLIQELDELYIYIYIYIYVYMYIGKNMLRIGKIWSETGYFQKNWFLTGFCLFWPHFVYIYICIYIYIHKGGSVGNPLTQILSGGP